MKKNIKFSNYLRYYSSLFLIIAAFLIGFRSTIGVSNFDNNIIYRLMSGFAWLLIYLSLFLNTYEKKDLLVCIMLISLPIIVFLHSKVSTPFLNTIVIIAAYKKKLRDVLKANFWGILIASVITITAYSLKIIPDTISRDGSKSFGFFNPNAFPIRFSTMVFLACIIWHRKIKISHLIFINVLSIYIYKVTGSRAGLIIILGFTIIVGLAKLSKIVRVLVKKFAIIGAIIIAAFSVFGVFFYAVIPFLKQIDEILSGRLSQPLYYFALYLPQPFGNYIREFQIVGARPKHFTIDNGYIRILIEWGYLYLIFYLFGYWMTIKRLIKQNEYVIMITILSVLLYMLSESVFCSLNANWIIILCSQSYFNKRLDINNEIALE